MFKREIGSEFHIDNKFHDDRIVLHNVFTYLQEFNTAFFDSGRSALRALLEEITSGIILLPDYICESVRDCFPESRVIYYHVDHNFCIDWEDVLEKCTGDIDILYLHYFNGYIGDAYDFGKLLELKKENNFIIVEDTTHSFLSASQTVGDYCICSLRKWFPVPDGGVLYSKKKIPLKSYIKNIWADKKVNAMLHKGLYLEGHNIEKSAFLKIFTETEQLLDEQKQSFGISEQSYDILKCMDINKIAEVRRNNYLFLSEKLSDKRYKQVACNGKNQVPLFFMVSVEKRDTLRKYLIDSHIYCPVHWPLYDELKEFEGAVFNNGRELSIPIDQRYGIEDMLYIADRMSAFSKEYV